MGGVAPFVQLIHDGQVVAACAFVFGQQRRVEVDCAQSRNAQEFITQLAPVKDGQAQIVFQTAFTHCFQSRIEGVQGQAQFLRGSRGRRALQMTVGQNADDFDMVLFGQKTKQVGGNLFATHK